jgi:hypothetical protein
MDTFFPAWLDRLFREHPRVMLLCLIVLALVVSLMVLSQTAQEIVAYEAF